MIEYIKSLHFSELTGHIATAPGWAQGLLLALATFFISEDLTTLAAGLMVAQGQLTWSTAFWGCFLGIFLGDGLLYVLGLLIGRPVLNWPLFRNLLSEDRVKQGEKWFNEKGIAMVFASRFLPGTRLPTYFAAGLMRANAKYFLMTASLACLLWTPLLIGLAYWFGQRVLLPFQFMQSHPLLSFLLGLTLLFLLFNVVNLILNQKRRALLMDRLYRWTHWEFWPLKVFYTPVFLYNLWQAIRFRNFHSPLYCNPDIPFSGFAGESKSAILELFNDDSDILPFLLVDPKEISRESIQLQLQAKGICFPLILKPDCGERGSGVKRISDLEQLEKEMKTRSKLQILQKLDPGPFEFGISYVRLPGETKGRIMGITGKKFPYLVGNGKDTQKTLILQCPEVKGRFRLLSQFFTDHVLDKGEILKMVEIGNHCLGTLFNDQSHLINPVITDKIDRLAQKTSGLFIGRFDVRVNDLHAFVEQGSFKVMEFNGATSEPAYVYDPSFSIFRAWAEFFTYWSYIWEIGLYHQRTATQILTWKNLRLFAKENK